MTSREVKYHKRKKAGYGFRIRTYKFDDFDKKIPVNDEPSYFKNFAMSMPAGPTNSKLKPNLFNY